ncbi:breast carcinoma-amplified sequence 4 isoform X3 [Opisthocomus hoazin]|uniref:breast carcinoma-amplified sequence 4 isoform X3 n=1 Tax=Opisthocomus hoazin TaxID=30419 RepID=UPI003F52F6A3
MLRPGEPPESRAGTAAEESGARRLARRLTPPPGEEVKEVEETIDELLGRLDEFCGITDAIRSDTSEILDETIPLIKDKVVEMNHVYAKVDKLEAFVKMVAHHVSFLEEQVLEAEKSHGTFLNTVCNLFPCVTISSFKNCLTRVRWHCADGLAAIKRRLLGKVRVDRSLRKISSISSTLP